MIATPVGLDAASVNALAALLAEGQSANTLRSYQTALRYWGAWFALRYEQPLTLPVAPATVLQFVIDHALHREGQSLRCELPDDIDQTLVAQYFKGKRGPLALSTLNHRISTLSQLHRLKDLPNPCEDLGVRHLLARTRRAYASRGTRTHKQPALTQNLLVQLLATCDDSLVGLRDRALLLFAVSTGGRRRSEITNATLERLRFIEPGKYVYVLGQTKTDQLAQEDANAIKPVVGDAALALEAWLAAANIHEGTLFRRLYRGKKVGDALNPAAVREIVQSRAKKAGLAERYSAHSLRAGFMTEAGLRGVPLGEAMALSGHASMQVAMGYFRAGNVLSSDAARLFDSSSPSPQARDRNTLDSEGVLLDSDDPSKLDQYWSVW